MASIASVTHAPARVASGRVERLRPRAGAARARNPLGLRASRPARAGNTAPPRAAEMMGVPLYADDLLEACAPWGNVCVVAGKHLVSADENGLSDPYVQVHLDNSPSAECTAHRHRTQTQRRTLNPVWGEGNGETFTFRRAPGAAEVQLRVWDADAVSLFLCSL